MDAQYYTVVHIKYLKHLFQVNQNFIWLFQGLLIVTNP